MQERALLIVTAGALLAIAAFPTFVSHRVGEARAASIASPAPVLRDYERRDTLVAFWEGAAREHHRNDMLSPRELAGQYLQRYRERGDIDDVIRAQQMAERSLAIAPHSMAALADMAAVMLTLHRFRDALTYAGRLTAYDPTNPGFLAQRASLEMELGEYERARATLAGIRPSGRSDVAAETVLARYDELTGHADRARRLLADATAQIDALAEVPAQARAWYHFRAGELAFEAGDNEAAIRDEQDAIAIFPTYNLALKDLARFELAVHRVPEALAAALKGAEVTPFPETLGYAADAQAALGQTAQAAATRDTIFTIERLGNAYRVNDRLLATYYADHRLRADDAFAIARREAALRGDEIYAQDTLAWTAAMDGHTAVARRAIAKALRYDTEDPLLQYHAGAIARQAGDAAEAKRRFTRALELNSQFHPVFADEARRALADL